LKGRTEAQFISKSVLQKLKGMRYQLSLVETKIADYMVAYPFRTIRRSTEELAEKCGTSQSSIIRFCQKMGYTGFRELKIVLAQEVGSLVPTAIAEPGRQGDSDYVVDVFSQTVEGMQRTVATLDRKMLDAAIHAIGEARMVDVYGAGESYVVGKDLQLKLRRLGIIANIYPNPHLQSISAASLKPGDVAVGISFSGCTQDTIDAIGFAAESGATTIAITNFLEFPLAEKADIVLETNTVEVLSPYGIGPFRLAQHLVVDLIFGGLLMTHKGEYREAYEYYNKIIQRKMQ